MPEIQHVQNEEDGLYYIADVCGWRVIPPFSDFEVSEGGTGISTSLLPFLYLLRGKECRCLMLSLG